MTDHVLVLGTHNHKKRLELELLLAPLGLTLRTLDEFPDALAVEETGTTFSENAALKAAEQAQHCQTLCTLRNSFRKSHTTTNG